MLGLKGTGDINISVPRVGFSIQAQVEFQTFPYYYFSDQPTSGYFLTLSINCTVGTRQGISVNGSAGVEAGLVTWPLQVGQVTYVNSSGGSVSDLGAGDATWNPASGDAVIYVSGASKSTAPEAGQVYFASGASVYLGTDILAAPNNETVVAGVTRALQYLENNSNICRH